MLQSIFHAKSRWAPPSWVGDHAQTTLWQINKNLKSETGHGTQKPVEVMATPPLQPYPRLGTGVIHTSNIIRMCRIARLHGGK